MGDDLFEKYVATLEAFLLVLEKASIHPIRVSMKTRTYMVHLMRGMLLKSTCQPDPGK
jgi:hypothetical protein